MVSILGEYNYNFPKPFDLEHRISDYLLSEVDEKYYLSGKQIKFMKETTFKSMSIDRVNQTTGVCETLTTMTGGNREPKVFESLISNSLGSRENEASGRFTETPTLCAREYKEPKSDKSNRNNRFYKQALDTFRKHDCNFGDTISAYNESVDKSGSCPTITTRPEGLKTGILPTTHDYRIRKLVPIETGRLMGMNDVQIDKQLSVVSNSQAYKQHGNGIVAQVIGLIIGMMWYEDELELRNTVLRNSYTWTKG